MTLTPQQFIVLMEQVAGECELRLSVIAKLFQVFGQTTSPALALTAVESIERLEQVAERCHLKVSKVTEVLSCFSQHHARLVAEAEFLAHAEAALHDDNPRSTS